MVQFTDDYFDIYYDDNIDYYCEAGFDILGSGKKQYDDDCCGGEGWNIDEWDCVGDGFGFFNLAASGSG